MICLNFGDGLDASKGYINTFDLAQEQANDKGTVFEPWAWADFSSIKDNSVCSAKFDYTLERINGGKENLSLLQILKELYRICAHGAYIKITTAAPIYNNAFSDPAIVRNITVDAVKFFDAQQRKVLAQDKRSYLTCKAFDQANINFKLLKTNYELSPVLIQAVKQNNFETKEQLEALIAANPKHCLGYTFHLVCVKQEGDFFALINMPKEIATLDPAAEQEFNAKLPQGQRHAGDLSPFIMRTYDPDVYHSYIAQSLHYIGSWEPGESLLVSQIINMFAQKYSKFKFANIGANIGWYSIVAAKLTHKVSVDAFEPNPKTIEILNSNVELNQLERQIKVFGFALSNEKSKSDFFVNKHNDGSSSLVHNENLESLDQTKLEQIQIATDTMDNVYGALDPKEWPNVILMDTEGHEQFVLDGAKNLFERGFKPLIVSEFAPNLMALRGKPDFYHNLINNYGYQVYVIVFDETQTSAQLKLVDGAYLDEAYERLKNPQKDEEAGFMNVIFVPDYFEQKDGGLGFKK